MPDINNTLKERGGNYGDFHVQAKTSQAIKDTLSKEINRNGTWELLDEDMIEALEMISVKISRIVCGNPKYADSWHDIAGYATLIADRLMKEEKKSE